METKNLCDITKEEGRQNLSMLMRVPSDLHDIQPQDTQCWNCDKIGIDPHGEHALFWITLLIFIHADGQCFLPPVIVHKGKYVTKEILYNIPPDWIVH
eukprot:2798091-Ditylum_brightwellii.AAC.1